mgnify:CR=1 FL=1
MNSEPTPQQPTLDELIEQGKDDLFLAASGFSGAEIEEATKKKSTDDLLSGSSTGLSSVDSPSELQSPKPDADLVDWASGQTILMNSVTENTFDVNTGEVTGEVVTTAAPGSAFVQPSITETTSDIEKETDVQRQQLGEDADFYGAPKKGKKRVVAFGRGEDTYERYRALSEGPAAKALEYRETARALAKKTLAEQATSMGSPEEQAAQKSLLETLKEAHEIDPNSTQFNVDAITNERLQIQANNNEGYTALRERTSKELEEVTERLKANQYSSDTPIPGAPSYAQDLKSSREKRLEDESRRAELLAVIADDHTMALERERRTILQEAYQLANPAPQRKEGEGFGEFKEREMDWQTRVRQVEHMLLKGGLSVDIDDDGYLSEPSSGIEDRIIDVALMVNQIVDMSAYGVGTAFSMLPGAEESMMDHVRQSRELQKRLRSKKSTKAISFAEEARFGAAEWKDSMVFLDDVIGNSIVSLPHTAVAIGVGAVTKIPYASAAAVSYLAGVQQYWESKVDPSFDTFTVNGASVGPITMGKINEYYATKGNTIKTDEEGDYILISGQRIDVEQNNTMRWGYSTAIGFAEGIPEAVGAKLLTSAIKQAGIGGSSYALENMFKGAFKAYGKGFAAEAPQEAVTEYLTILADASIKGEYIDPVEAFARISESFVTGGFSGGGISSVVTTTQRINQTINAADSNIKGFWNRLESGHKKLQAQQPYQAVLNNVTSRLQEVRLPGMEEANKAADQLREAQKSGNATEIELAELNLREKLDEVEVQDEQLKEMVSELSQSDPALAATIVDLAEQAQATEDVLKRDKKVIDETPTARPAASQAAKTARENLNKAIEEGQKRLEGREKQDPTFVQESQTEGLTEGLSKSLLEMEQDFKPTAQEMSDVFGKPIEEVQKYLEQVSASTAYAAMSVGQMVQVYESDEAYLAAVPDRALAERLQTSAQYDPKTGTIHLSPKATAFDVIEESIHNDVRAKGIEAEDLKQMAEELLNSDNEEVKRVAEARSQRYSDSRDQNEEIVVGVLREVKGPKFQNQQLRELAAETTQKYGTQRVQASMDEAMTSEAVKYDRYAQIYSDYAKAGLSDLDRRFGKDVVDQVLEERERFIIDKLGDTEATPRTADELRQDVGYNDVLDILDDIEIDGDRTTMNKGYEKSARFGVSNTTTREVYDAMVKYKGLIGEDGILLKDVPVLVMSIDEVGNTTWGTKIYESGMDMEKASSEQRVKFIAASSDQATATRFMKSLTELLPENSNTVLILYKNMGVDAAQSNVSFFKGAMEAIKQKLADGEISYQEAKKAIIDAHESSISLQKVGRGKEATYESKKDQPLWYVNYYVNTKKGRKIVQSEGFNSKREAESWRAQNVKPEFRLLAGGLFKHKQTTVLRVSKAFEEIVNDLRAATKDDIKVLVDEYIGNMLNRKFSNTQLPMFFSMSINQRNKFLNAPAFKKILSQADRQSISDRIVSPFVKPGTFGMINGFTIAEIDRTGFNRADKKGGLKSSPREVLAPEGFDIVTQYKFGIPVSRSEFHELSEAVDPIEFKFSSEALENSRKRGKFANEVVDSFSVEEAKLDREEAASQDFEPQIIMKVKDSQEVTQLTSSRFMGMPDKPFTMNYTEEVVNSKGTWSNQVHRQKKFQDGWHFWNWWVLQTGNGKVDKLGAWGYTDENGAYRILGKIPKKKDRSTGEVLDLEPLFRSNQQRQIDRNVRDAEIAAQREEQRESDFLAAEQELKEKLDEEGSDYSYSVLANGYGTSELSAPGSMGGFNNRSAEVVRKVDAFYEVTKKIKNLQPGEKTAWMPSDYSDASQVMEGMELVTLAGRGVNFGADFSLGKLINFRRERQFLEREEPNLVYSIENIDGKYVARLSIAVSAENMDLIEEFRKRPKPKTRQEFLDAFEVFREGEIIDDSDARSARFMPPRYYQLKEERGAYQGTIDFLNTWLVNKYADVIGLEKQVEKERGKKLPESQRFSEVEQLMYGRARQAMDNLEVVMQDARAKMKEFGLTHSEVSEFMYALHARERNAKILKTRPDLPNGSGMTDERADEILVNSDNPQMREVVKMFSDLVQDTRNTMVEMGLETQQRIDSWNELYENYVPLQGFAEDELDLNSNSYPTGGAGMSVYGSKTKAAIGRESEAANVLANIVMQNAVTHQWAEKNRTLQAMYQLVKKNPQESEGVMSIVNQSKPLTKLDENGKQVAMTIAEMETSPNTVAVRIDGKQEFIYFNDPYYASVLSGMTMENSNTFIKMLRGPVGWLRGVFTQWDPNFFVSNFARDMGGSIYNAASDLENGELGNIDTKGFQKEMMGNSFKFLKALLRTNAIGKPLDAQTEAWIAEWKEGGGQTGWNYIDNLKEIEEKLMVLSDDITKTQALKESIFGTPQKFFGWVEGVNEAFENSIRLSAYVTARNRGASRQQSAVFSKNITVNFNRSGEAGPVLNSVYLFFNAAIQGNLRVYNSVAKPKPIKRPDGTSRKFYERATNAQKIGAGMAGFSGMLTLLNIALSGKDPEDDELWYNKISEYDKSRNMIICYGQDRDDFFKIPLPYGYGLFNNMGMALAETSTGNRSINSAINLLGTTAFTSFSPISFGGIDENPGAFVLRSFAPTVVKPFVEMAENKTYFGAPVTGEQLPFGTPVPQSQLSFRSPLKMQEYFEFMNQATGGSQFKSGWADFNPDYGWYLFEYMVGGSGQFIMQSGEQARNLYEMSRRSAEKVKEATTIDEVVKSLGYGFGEEGEVKIRYNEVPIVKKLYGEASPFYDVERFKENQEVVKQLYREIREKKIVAEPGRYNGIQGLYEDLKKRDKLLKSVRENIRKARDIDNYIDRQNRIFELYETQRRVMAEWNYKYDTIRGKD